MVEPNVEETDPPDFLRLLRMCRIDESKEKIAMREIRIFLLMVLSDPKIQNRYSKIILPNHLIRSHQHVRRNRQTDLLRAFRLIDEFKLRRLLDR